MIVPQLAGVRQYADFCHLGVEELGTVYESLVAYTIRITEHPRNVDRMADRGGPSDGTKQLDAVADGYRESTDSRADVLRGLHNRGLRGPELAVGDGALGFWAAVRDVFDGKVRKQRCWVHKTANILDVLPKRLHGDARPAIQAIYLAETRADAIDRAHTFADRFTDLPKAIGKITAESSTPCWRSTTSPKSTGSICAPPTPSSRRSPPSG